MGKQIDELAKALASGRSRRRALRRFAGGVIAAALAGLWPRRTAQAAFDAGSVLDVNVSTIFINGRCITVSGDPIKVKTAGSIVTLDDETRCFPP